MRRIILDCDPGCDDVLALQFLLNRKDVDLMAITTVAGNATSFQGAVNALKVLKLNNSEVPVFRGHASPMVIIPEPSESYHGSDGLLDVKEDDVQIDENLIQKESAAQAIVRLVNENENMIDIIAIGPLTNLAMAMNMDPSLGDKLKSVTIMGGNLYGIGNISMCAEFNFHYDPEAAYVVLNRLPKTCKGAIVAWECTMDNMFSGEGIGLKRGKSALGDFFYPRTVKMRGFPDVDASKDEMCICDLLAAVVSLHPELISTEDNFSVSVELGGTYTRGMMVIDRKIEEHPGVTLNKHCVFKLPKQLDMKKIMDLDGMNFS